MATKYESECIYGGESMKGKKLKYYEIRLSIDEFHQWHNELLLNRGLSPEIVGILLGRAIFIKKEINEATNAKYQ